MSNTPSDNVSYTPSDKVVGASRDIAAPANVIFDLLADPRRHHEIDGSDMVQAAKTNGPERLSLGARFGMKMKIGPLPYQIDNEVVAFEEDRRIAWRHLGHHVWSYELEPIEGGTRVSETFDWGVARFPPIYEWVGYPAKHQRNIERTLKQLETAVTKQ